MACNVSEELTAFADGELSPADAARVEAHLATCAECAQDLALIRGVPSKLAQLPPLEPSQQLRRNVLNALPERRPGWLLRWLLPAAGLAAAAAATVVVLHKPAQPVDELALAQNLDVVQDLGALQTADLSDEDLEVVANLDQLERKE